MMMGRRWPGEDVVGGHHQCPGLDLGLDGQRHVHRHLVAVKVGVEGGTDQGMELDGLALDEQRLKGLNPQRCRVGARLSITGCSRTTSSRISQTSGVSRSTRRLATLMVVA